MILQIVISLLPHFLEYLKEKLCALYNCGIHFTSILIMI